jgi:hypothetical protein
MVRQFSAKTLENQAACQTRRHGNDRELMLTDGMDQTRTFIVHALGAWLGGRIGDRLGCD